MYSGVKAMRLTQFNRTISSLHSSGFKEAVHPVIYPALWDHFVWTSATPNDRIYRANLKEPIATDLYSRAILHLVEKEMEPSKASMMVSNRRRRKKERERDGQTVYTGCKGGRKFLSAPWWSGEKYFNGMARGRNRCWPCPCVLEGPQAPHHPHLAFSLSVGNHL